MKKAYLFGAAALLILLIVVAYISSNRQKEEAVCVRPSPQVVGPTADSVVKILSFDDADDDILPLNRSEPAFGRANPTEIRIPTLTYVNRPKKIQRESCCGSSGV